jgi:cysteine desulfurase
VRHYLDHASTSPARPEAVAAVSHLLGAPTGDPGRIHQEGMTARAVVEDARCSVASLLGARPREVVFTSGATEAIAAACWGAAGRGGHQVLTAVEHSAVRKSAASHGEVTLVGVERTGTVDPAEVAAAIRPGETSVVHVQHGNHEVGTLQPIAEVIEACRPHDVLVHVDAAQSAGHVPVDFHGLGADLVSVSAHKFGGPPGVGALLIRRGLRLPPLLGGGDQERARRAGMEPVALMAGFGAAAAAVLAPGIAHEEAEQQRLTDRLVDGVAAIEGVERYGAREHHLPHIACFGVEDVEPQAVLLGLDRAGVAVHSGSACASEGLEPSPVLEAMGVDAHHSLRVSVGWSSTDADVDAFLDALPRVLAELRALGSS